MDAVALLKTSFASAWFIYIILEAAGRGLSTSSSVFLFVSADKRGLFYFDGSFSLKLYTISGKIL